MDNEYEVQEQTLSLYSATPLIPLGLEGWEVFEVNSPRMSAVRLRLRRPNNGPAQRWEYAVFDESRMPHPEWDDHLSACGWKWFRLEEYGYGPMFRYLCKRSDSYTGTDDGDVVGRLNALGYSLPYVNTTNQVRDLLRLKWLESEKRHTNIGTWQAARLWIAYRIVPGLLQQNGVATADLNLESVLEDLMELRNASAGTLSLETVCQRWAALHRNRSARLDTRSAGA